MKKLILIFAIIFCAVLSSNAQWAKAHSVNIVHNFNDNGRSMLKVRFKVEAHGLQGHTLVPVLFIDRAKGVSHFFKDGRQMRHDGVDYYAPYPDTYWNGDDQFIGIYNDALNPLPGNNTYNVRILIWDKSTSTWASNNDVNATEWCSYDMAGAAQGFTPGPSGLLIDNCSCPIVAPYTPAVNNNSNSNSNSNYDRHNAKCAGCGGTGTCRHCGGTGQKTSTRIGGGTYKCSSCNGSGRCTSCHGTGNIRGNY